MLIILILIYSIGVIKTDTHFGLKNYTEFESGNFNILISVPHDGKQHPEDIPDRTEDGLGNLLGDYNTRPFAQAFSDELSRLFGLKPFMVFNNLHRKKMDANRNSSVCCATLNLDCHSAHFQYHSFISKYVKDMGLVYKNLLIFDIHGQSHKENWTEIGYLLSKTQLNQDVLMETSLSSIDSLKVVGGYSLEQIIRGDDSLGAFMDQRGFRVVPSPSIKSPGDGSYYSGGYITSSHKSKNVNTIQIELPYSLRSLLSNTKIYGTKLAQSVHDFYKFHKFNLKL